MLPASFLACQLTLQVIDTADARVGSKNSKTTPRRHGFTLSRRHRECRHTVWHSTRTFSQAAAPTFVPTAFALLGQPGCKQLIVLNSTARVKKRQRQATNRRRNGTGDEKLRLPVSAAQAPLSLALPPPVPATSSRRTAIRLCL